VVLGLTGRFSCRNERHFDVLGYHPKVESVRSVRSAVGYCRKEDTEPLISRGWAHHGQPSTLREKWREAIKIATKQEFLDHVRENFSDKWVLENQKILAYADRYYDAAPLEHATPTCYEFQVPALIASWVAENVSSTFNLS
jgi:hypothetical protein